MRERGSRREDELLPDRPARQPVEHAGDLLHRLSDHPVQRVALAGQRNRAMQPMEQAGAEQVFEELDLPAHRSLRDTELVRGQREAAEAGNRLELDERRHGRNEPSIAFGSCRRKFHPTNRSFEVGRIPSSGESIIDRPSQSPRGERPSCRPLRRQAIGRNQNLCRNATRATIWLRLDETPSAPGTYATSSTVPVRSPPTC